MNKLKALILTVFFTALLMSSTTWASTARSVQADTIYSTSGSSLAVPATGANLISDSASQTLTNKTISGASNTLSNIPASAVSSGQVAVPNGGTGDSAFTLNGILFGNNGSALQVTASGTQYQPLQAGAAGVPTFGALHLDQSAAVSGALGAANGGTGQTSLTSGDLVVGNGTGAVSFIAPGANSGYVLQSNGTSFVMGAVPQAVPVLNGGSGNPQVVTAIGGVSLSGLSYNNIAFIAGSGGAVTVSATPSITACTASGQLLTLIGESATNTVTLQDQGGLSGSKLSLNGNWTASLDSVLNLVCDGSIWVETSRR